MLLAMQGHLETVREEGRGFVMDGGVDWPRRLLLRNVPGCQEMGFSLRARGLKRDGAAQRSAGGAVA